MRSRPTTRASVNDIITGNDIHVGATPANAIDFMNLQFDDIELINYVKTLRASARAWHSQNIIKHGMMWRSIVSVLNNEAGSNGTGKAFLEEHNDVEFLGFVNVYNKANADRTVQAFHIVAMALFRYDQTNKRTVIGCVIATQEMRCSMIQERLIQMVQLLQLCRNDSSALIFDVCVCLRTGEEWQISPQGGP